MAVASAAATTAAVGGPPPPPPPAAMMRARPLQPVANAAAPVLVAVTDRATLLFRWSATFAPEG
jgi:hypothetical protein